MGDKKTIQFNPAFMKSSTNKTRKNKKEKKEKPKPVIKPNKLKKDLLEKIKKHQQNERIKNTPDNDNNTENNDKEFHNDFVNSLDYLNNLSNKKRTNAKKQKGKQNKTLKNPIKDDSAPNVSFDNSQLVSIDLPMDFDLNNDISQTTTQMNGQIKNITNQINNAVQLTNVVTENMTNTPKIGGSAASTVTPSTVTPSTVTPSTNMIINPDSPYGCLKGGNKPTYRQFHNKTLKNTNNTNVIVNNNGENVNSSRRENLNKLKKSYKKIRQKSKKTRKYTYNLGKKNKNISILIKNNKTRRNVKKEHGLLKQKPLQEVKKYLYDRNFLKIGSTAPNDVLRTLYEQSILAGDVSNINNGVTLHNFLEK
jgi:hypothetical protein